MPNNNLDRSHDMTQPMTKPTLSLLSLACVLVYSCWEVKGHAKTGKIILILVCIITPCH